MVKEVVSPSLWGAWALTSLVVALAGPFGTFDSNTFLWRLAYWSILIAVAIVIAIFCRTVWRHILVDCPIWIEDLAVAVSLSVLFGPLVMMLNKIVGGDEAWQVMGLWAAMGCVLIVAIATIAVRHAIREMVSKRDPAPARDRLLERISAMPDARLSRISSDNHHIRIITNDGNEHRLLMRLRDAVSEIDVEPGMFVHRSHWVAEASIARIVETGGRESVELPCGQTLPIGPKFRPNLVEAGVISE